jgi:hypothetical protein
MKMDIRSIPQGWSTASPGREEYSVFMDAKNPEAILHEGGHLVSHDEGAKANNQAFSGIKHLYNKLSDKINSKAGFKLLPRSELNTRNLARNLNFQQSLERTYRDKGSPFLGAYGFGGLVTALTAPKDSVAAKDAWKQPWIASLPRLAEEARASILGLKEMRRTGMPISRALRNTGLALGTYLSKPAAESAGIEAGYLARPDDTGFEETWEGKKMNEYISPLIKADATLGLADLGLNTASFTARKLVGQRLAQQLAARGVTQALTTGAAGTGLVSSVVAPAALVAGTGYGAYTGGSALDQAANPKGVQEKMLPQEYSPYHRITRPDQYNDAVRKQTGGKLNSERPWEDLSPLARIAYNVDNWVNGTGANVPKEKPLSQK